jgi:uncharacterized protein YkwD
MKFFRLIPALAACLLLLDCTDETIAPDPLYENVPDIASCKPGSLSEAEKEKVLKYINSVRAIHNLPDVTYDSRKDRIAQEAALIGAANAGITEAITDVDLCYSEDAALECRRGNRSFWGSENSKWPSSEIHINDWMTELNSENINSRRRILDPFLKEITFGRIIGSPKKVGIKYVSSAILMTADGAKLDDSEISYIAYPQGNYGTKLFDPNSTLSFSVLHDKTGKSSNRAVDFSETTVEVSIGSQVLSIVEGSLSYDNNDYGLPNNLQWKIAGLEKNVTYTVKIQGVKIAKETMNYGYAFSFR